MLIDTKRFFGGKKGFCSDKSDKLSFYWHELRTEPRRFSKHQQRCALLKFWSAILFYEQFELVLVR